MATILKQSTQVKVRIGPFVDVTDGYTPETGVALSTADEAELLKANGAATTDISGATWAAVTGADGWYDLTLTTSHTDTVGELVVVVQDDSVCLPVFARFQVVEEATYDALFGASAAGFDANGRVDVGSWNGTSLGTTNPLPNAAAGASGGLLISGSNTGTVTFGAFTVTGLMSINDGLDISCTTLNRDGIEISSGGGTGKGVDVALGGVSVTGGIASDITGDITGNLSGSVGSLTGHTVQTGDTYALANGAAGFVAIDTVVDAIKAVTDNLPDSGALSTITTHLTDIKGGTFSGATDSLEAIRDRGDSAWITATAVTVSDKTGFKLASDGLDLVIPADPSAVPTLGTSSIVTDVGFIIAALLGQRTFNTTTKVETLYNQAGSSIATGTWAYAAPTTTRPELT